jgi:hypothetical protein
MAVDLSANITQLGLMATPSRFFVLSEIPSGPIYIPPSTTTVYGWFREPDGEPRSGLVVLFTTKEKIESGSAVISKGQSEEVITDSEGYFEITLVSGLYDLKIDCTELYGCVRIPDSTEDINIQELI